MQNKSKLWFRVLFETQELGFVPVGGSCVEDTHVCACMHTCVMLCLRANARLSGLVLSVGMRLSTNIYVKRINTGREC